LASSSKVSTAGPAGTFRTKDRESLIGTELAALAGADFYREINLRELYTRIKLLGKVQEGYRELYMLEAVSRNGAAENLYFDAESGLLIHSDVTQRTSQGSVRTEVYVGDWREVDGVKVPFQVTQSMPNMRFVVTLEDIKHNCWWTRPLFKTLKIDVWESWATGAPFPHQHDQSIWPLEKHPSRVSPRSLSQHRSSTDCLAWLG
jgi:hypothetical protein